MAVASRGAALTALRTLLNHEPVPVSTLLRRPYLPDDLAVSDDPVRLTPDTRIGGYGNEERYRLGGGDVERQRALALPPASVLTATANASDVTTAAYTRASLDLTMEGGTTSGVVYPLAVCELATQFRFRNVGGASAGAIAAAMTAAAELGRSSAVLDPGPDAPADRPADVAGGPDDAVRRGFVGLTDVIGWLTQTRTCDPDTDELRLGQLFRPAGSTARIFRIVIAAMRGRGWSFPLVALFAFGRITRVIAILLMLFAAALTGWVAAGFSDAPDSWLVAGAWGLLGAAEFAATLVAGVVLSQGVRAVLADRTPATGSARLRQLRSYSSAYGRPPARARQPLLLGAILVVGVLTLSILRPYLYAAAVLVGLAVAAVLVVVLGRSVLVYLARLRNHEYGLIAGATPRRSRGFLDVIAGTPKPTVDESLVPWLTRCLSSLAGLDDGQVLRFGHLWAGLDFEQRRQAPTPADLELWQQMAGTPDRCLVNLQLMTTDLTRERPFRFPLPPWSDDDPEQLWVCVDQLRDGESAIFTEDVLAALETPDPRQVHDHLGRPRTLHRLPQPWDLPVIFAVRISMALPALFHGVPLYQIPTPLPAQDDLGRTLLEGGVPLVLSGQLDVAQVRWFADGGITSNFPVHFFDNPLPRWPTVSLNLGTHPDDAPHTDVWLPQDWEQLTAPVATIDASGLAYAGAIFDTALNWRDRLQSDLPGYRNRTAQVRTGQGEGGNNLFMPREVVASMALRGALAGARLRTRFADQTHWDRFRWLRLRTAMNNLETARLSVAQRRGFYADALAGPDWLRTEEAVFSDRTADVPWYRPGAAYWPDAGRLLDAFADSYHPDAAGDVMITGSPLPQPVLRQVPME